MKYLRRSTDRVPAEIAVESGSDAASAEDASDDDGLQVGAFGVVANALSRMRLLAAALLSVQILTYRPGPDEPDLPVHPWVVVAVLAAVTLATNRLGALERRSTDPAQIRRLGLAQLVADVALVLSMTTFLQVGDNDVLWILLVVPVLEGALRYRMRGAAITWAIVAVLYLALRINAAGGADPTREADVLAELALAVQRLGVVLLVIIPGAYLSEQLVLDIRSQTRAQRSARVRSRLLEVVASAGHRVTSLQAQAGRAVIDAARDLGFDAVDLARWSEDEGWTGVAHDHAIGARLPDPGLSAGGADAARTNQAMVIVDLADGDEDERAGLEAAGLASVVAAPVAAFEGRVVLRAGLTEEDPPTAAQLECLGLLTAQAGVALRNGQLLAQQQAMQQQFAHQAFHDGLTGLPNRARFYRRLEEILPVARQPGHEIAVLFVDLDRFKPVNDTLGHDAGNELLVSVAKRLRTCAEEPAMVARLGGDEFAIVLENVRDPRRADAVAELACQALAQPFAIMGHQVVISGSIGLALSEPAMTDAEELVRRADQAMYRAKGMGRANWRRYDPTSDLGTSTSVTLGADLRDAIEQNHLRLVYQPIMSGEGTEVVGAEALLRWHHPTEGDISPPVVFQVAEDSGLGVELGRWVLRTACSDARTWPAGSSLTRLGLAVNVSPAQLHRAGFLTDVDTVLREAGIPPGLLILEVSEHTVVGEEALRPVFEEIRARGIRLALDDFGSGQTALRHLAEIAFDVLKLDQSFMPALEASPQERSIVGSVISLAHELGIRVVCEGVEEAQQAQIVRTLGADMAQGYLFHRPMPAAEFAQLVGAAHPSTSPVGVA